MSEEYVLQLQHIRKEYPGVVALKDVTLELKAGEILALIGENGAGKSTLIKCCSGAVIPTSGKIIVNGKEFSSPVTVVYGHNMKNGSMFADLHKYEDKAFFDANPYVYIYTPDRTLKYHIFSATPFDDRYLLGSYNFSSQVDFEKYLDELRSSINGNVNMGVNVLQQTGILTLSTCIADSPNERFLVNATWEE